MPTYMERGVSFQRVGMDVAKIVPDPTLVTTQAFNKTDVPANEIESVDEIREGVMENNSIVSTAKDSLWSEVRNAPDLFSWDDFLYNVFLGLAPTAWDTSSDLLIAAEISQGAAEGAELTAGLTYMFITLPVVLQAFHAAWALVPLAHLSRLLAIALYLVLAVGATTAVIALFHFRPSAFYYPATGVRQ